MSRRSSIATVVALGGVIAVTACTDQVQEVVPPPPQIVTATDTSPRPPDLADSESWVSIYDPELAWNGYTLAFFMRRVPILMDMNGRVVHSWPEARVKSRLRLSTDGSLLAIGLDRSVVEYDWEGNLLWSYTFETETPHHEVVRLENGNVLTVVRPAGQRTDDLVEIDPSAQNVWTWKSGTHLKSFLGEAAEKGDITHINSVQELPNNPWWESGDERFRPGNLLISARNLNLIFIADRATGEVVWSYDRELDLQHEALMLGVGTPGHGNIQLFNNGYRSSYIYRQSIVLEIDPRSKETVWEYSSVDFYSPTGGIEQPLPNGNVLISSSRSGRAFEITRDGETVWQWTPPYDPNRPQRYPFDHCPQLASIEPTAAKSVEPASGYRYVDPAVYQFARRGAIDKINVDGTKINALRNGNDCRQLFLPPAAVVHLSYGLNRREIRRRGHDSYAARFGVNLRLGKSEEPIPVLEDTVDLSTDTWRSRLLELGDYAFRVVDLCVTTARVDSSDDDLSLDFAYWANPIVVAGFGSQHQTADPNAMATDLTAEELATQQDHLKTLGYLD